MRLATCVQFVAALTLAAMPSVTETVVAARAEQAAPKLSNEAKAYMDYRKEVPKAKRLEDLYFYFDAKSIEYYKQLPAPERMKIYQQLKTQVELFPTFTVVTEERGPAATIVMFNAKSADNKEAVVAVEIIREGAALKVGQATWKIPQ
jgi:hypothetical protein